MTTTDNSTRVSVFASLALAVTACLAPNNAEAQFNTGATDAVGYALADKDSTKGSGLEGWLGYSMAESLKDWDWPIAEEDVRKSHSDKIPADRDTDGDGIPDLEDPDMDGDGIPNSRDNDIDGDGFPNDEDEEPYDSKKHVWDPSSRYPDELGGGLYSYMDSFFLETSEGFLVEMAIDGYSEMLMVESMEDAMLVIEVSEY